MWCVKAQTRRKLKLALHTNVHIQEVARRLLMLGMEGKQNCKRRKNNLRLYRGVGGPGDHSIAWARLLPPSNRHVLMVDVSRPMCPSRGWASVGDGALARAKSIHAQDLAVCLSDRSQNWHVFPVRRLLIGSDLTVPQASAFGSAVWARLSFFATFPASASSL